jgi:hypothetical protein
MSEPSESLYEEIKKSFPEEELELYGLCLVVPSKAFDRSWESKLETESVKVFSSSYGNQACFFLRKSQAKRTEEAALPPEGLTSDSGEPQISPQTQKHHNSWTSENIELLKELYGKGTPVQEIAAKLGRTLNSCYKMAYKLHITISMKERGRLSHTSSPEVKAQPSIPEEPRIREPVQQVRIQPDRYDSRTTQYKPAFKHAKEEKPVETDDGIVKEFLAAASNLYPQYPRACAVLLQMASNKILGIE